MSESNCESFPRRHENGWISVKDKMPQHMQEVKVFVDSPYFGSYERAEKAVFLGFDGNFYDSEEQICLNYVTKWMPLPEPPKE